MTLLPDRLPGGAVQYAAKSVVLVSALAGTSLGRAEAPRPEYVLKAQILVNLLAYTQWPLEADPATRTFDLVVVGRSPFGTSLDDFARSRTFQHRPLRIRYLPRGGDPGSCAAVFLCRSEADRVEGLVAWARSHQVLTVSDDEAFARKGVMVNLLMEGRFVKLAVNPSVALAAGISFSSRLLRGARLLEPVHPLVAEPREAP